MNYWLIKSEPTSYSIDDLARDGTTAWTGVRNFQARNYMRDGMKKGDGMLFYHSSSEPTGVFGIGEVASAAYEDPTALDPTDSHFDARAAKVKKEGKDPMWICFDVKFVRKFAAPLTLATIKKDKILRGMKVAARGQRLSVMPVTVEEWRRVGEVVK